MIKTMSKCIENKDKEQRKALNLWAHHKFIGSIIAGTGFGKTRVGVLAVGKVLEMYPEGKALVLVPTTQLQEQFESEFLKWGYTDVLDRVNIQCYQSAYKFKNESYEIVIADEIHLGLSKQHFKFFENNKYRKLLCLTATIPEDEEYKFKLAELAPTVYRLKLDDCVKLGLVSPYEIYCMAVGLTEEEQAEYKKANNMFVHYKYKLGQFDAFNEAKRILASKNAQGHEKQWAVLFYKAIRARKAVVDFASYKIEALKTLTLQNPTNKILTFAGANEFTDKMCDALGKSAIAYHSKKTKKQKDEALKLFRTNKKRILCSTKALNQGFDVPDADMGIICGLTSKSLTMIQRVGRLLRFQENKIGKIVILYVENTQEEKWLKSAVKGLTNVNWVDLITEE
jgi:superfamily II DNA or RNA helicase|tara:strand:+ start:333 stop:1523 length:1191 start_codon:yes stop_codon:yes gene_type:complete